MDARCRVFVFGLEGDEQAFLSSAEWMPRHLHRRVERSPRPRAPPILKLASFRPKPLHRRSPASTVFPALVDGRRFPVGSRAPGSDPGS